MKVLDLFSGIGGFNDTNERALKKGQLHAVVHHHAQAGENIGSTLRLEPAFVEWMMGFPTNWTSLEAETTEPHD